MRVSRLFFCMFILLHLLATDVLLLTAAHNHWLYGILPLLCCSFIYHWQYAQLRLKNSVTQFGSLAPQQWFMVTNHHGVRAVEVCKNSVITRYLLLIYLKHGESRKRFLLFVMPDSLHFSEARTLRLALTCGRKKPRTRTLQEF